MGCWVSASVSGENSDAGRRRASICRRLLTKAGGGESNEMGRRNKGRGIGVKAVVSSFRSEALVVLGLLLSAHAWYADLPPEFTAAGVARGPTPAKILVPGACARPSIGQHLGPPGSGCAGPADPQRRETPNPRRPDKRIVDTSIYPTELCGTQAFIGDQAAGLLYVSERRIGFKIPQDAPESGVAVIRVVRMGQSSSLVTMEAGFEKTTVSLE